MYTPSQCSNIPYRRSYKKTWNSESKSFIYNPNFLAISPFTLLATACILSVELFPLQEMKLKATARDITSATISVITSNKPNQWNTETRAKYIRTESSNDPTKKLAKYQNRKYPRDSGNSLQLIFSLNQKNPRSSIISNSLSSCCGERPHCRTYTINE